MIKLYNLTGVLRSFALHNRTVVIDPYLSVEITAQEFELSKHKIVPEVITGAAL